MATDDAVEDLSGFLQLVQRESASDGLQRWYRGCGKSSYTLTPTLYRHPSSTSIEELMELESGIINRFKQRSVPYLTRSLSDDWEYLFFMQHYGVPTRLLDWTENPFFALYFGLASADYKLDNGEMKYSEDVAIWIINPVAWNRWALSYRSYGGGILSAGDIDMQAYTPKPDIDVMGNEPLAIYGTHNSTRIVAQRGVFTMFGKSTAPMEAKNFPANVLQKVIIPKNSISELFSELVSIGITDSSIFPDLDGLSKELKRSFGYRV